MPHEDAEMPKVSAWIRSLASQPDMPAFPDPDWLWIRSQISARHAAAARALRLSTLRQALRYGLVSAGVAWLILEWVAGEGRGLNQSVHLSALISADPVASVAVSALAAVGIAFLAGALVLGRSLVARRLKYLGLL